MSFQYVSKNSFQLSRSSQSFSRLIRLQRVGIGGSKCVVIGAFVGLSHFTDNTSAFTRFFQNFQSFCRKRPNSLLKKPPGEDTGPTIHVDFRGNLVGRVPSRGERDVFELAVSRFLSASMVVYLRFNCRF